MYLIIKAETLESAVQYAQDRFVRKGMQPNPNIRGECTLNPNEQKVWASNAWVKQAAQWFNDACDACVPYPYGTLLFFSADL